MKVWLVTVGEPLPSDGSGDRLHRASLLLDELLKAGHEVLWWSSTFNHARKEQRFQENTRIDVSRQFTMFLLFAKGYQRNVSLSRLVNHAKIAKEFKEQSQKEDLPDIIVASFPTIELCYEAVQFGKKHNIPVVIDVRDLWPDIFAEVAPGQLQWLVKLILFPLYRKAHKVFRNASAVIGITDSFVKWGLDKGKRNADYKDRSFPMGYPKKKVDPEKNMLLEQFWKSRGVDTSKFIVCFFGYFGRQIALETVIDAARILESRGVQDVQFVLCGEGDKFEFYQKSAQGLNNVLFPGWIIEDQILKLMELASFGVAPYFAKEDFLNSLPNKFFEYLAGGLVVLSSIEGEIGRQLKKHDCGFVYGSAEELSSIIVNIIRDPVRIETIQQNALKLYEDQFRADHVYASLVSHLENIAYLKEQN